MRISINTKELLFDIKNKSHEESAIITDQEARYKIEAGTEKEDDLVRGIITSLSVLHPILDRWMASDYASFADNNAGLPDDLIFEFNFSERRLDGKVQALTDAIHSFLVNNTLGNHYCSVGHQEFQTKRMQLAAVDAQLIDRLVYMKKAPYMMRH